jgi:DNA-binding transcriptional LysR family regulator
VPLMRQCYESALAVQSVAQSLRKGETVPLAVAVSHTVALSPITQILREMSRAFSGLQLKLRRGSGNEIGEFLKSGESELAIAGPLGDFWSRLDAFPLFDEPFDLFVSRRHRLAGKNAAQFSDLTEETLLINSQCEMVDDLAARLRAMNIHESRTHQVATQDDLLTLLGANLGIAIVPVGAVGSQNLVRVPLNDLNLVRKVSAYGVAGRRRSASCTAFLNMLRAADWGFVAPSETQWGMH